MRSLVLSEQDFEVLQNVTSPATMTPYASYSVPAGMYAEFDLTKPFIFKPALYEPISVITSMVNTTTNILTVTLTYPCVSDTPVSDNAIVAYDNDLSAYLTLVTYDASTKQVQFSFTTSPIGHVVDVYYPATQHFDKLVVAVPVGSGEDVYAIKSFDQGKLFLLNQNSAKQRLYLPKPVALIEDFKIQFMTRDNVRHAIVNVRSKTPLPNARLELPITIGSITEASARLGSNLKNRLINMYRQL
jgi:hypothetical protein